MIIAPYTSERGLRFSIDAERGYIARLERSFDEMAADGASPAVLALIDVPLVRARERLAEREAELAEFN